MTACPHCGYESTGLDSCPLCSSPLAQDAERPLVDAAAAGQPGALPASVPPWEDDVPFPRSITRTWLASLLEPGRFFRGVPYEAPALRPLLYFLILTVVAALFTLCWQAAGLETVTLFEGSSEELRGPSALAQFFISPFAGLLGLIIWCLILQLFVLMLVPTRRGLRATLRVVCYSAGPTVFTLIPFVGGVIAFVWSLVLEIIGIREAHRTTGGRAAAVALIPLALTMTLMVLFGAVLWTMAGELGLQDLP